MVADTIPPTIGAATRRITSEPVPVLHMIGSRPAMIATTVIILGRTRITAPCTMTAAAATRLRGRAMLCARSKLDTPHLRMGADHFQGVHIFTSCQNSAGRATASESESES